MNEWDVTRAFAEIPQLDDYRPADFSITALPGYTNRNYRLHNRDHDWVLRLPRPVTDRFINRDFEAHNQALAHDLGLAPHTTWRNTDGVSLTPTLAHSRNLRPADLQSDAGLAMVVQPLRRLHRSEVRFQGREDLAELLQSHYLLIKPERRAAIARRVAQARRILPMLEHDAMPPVPSHRDLVMENLLVTGERLWFIDWEYSAMASPYWDLATLCNEADLDLAQSRRLLQAYCAGDRPMKESTLFDYRGLLKLLTDCWMAALVES